MGGYIHVDMEQDGGGRQETHSVCESESVRGCVCCRQVERRSYEDVIITKVMILLLLLLLIMYLISAQHESVSDMTEFDVE